MMIKSGSFGMSRLSCSDFADGWMKGQIQPGIRLQDLSVEATELKVRVGLLFNTGNDVIACSVAVCLDPLRSIPIGSPSYEVGTSAEV